jgi:hypothetical protein
MISGRISADLSEDTVAEMLSFANKRTSAVLSETTTITTGGSLRRRFVLLDLNLEQG